MVKDKISLVSLTGIVIGAMIGGGIFSLPQNTAVETGAGGMLLGWLIAGVGMSFLIYMFIHLSLDKPELSSGIYSYAIEALGPFAGFISAWGYWLCCVIGNVSYTVLIFSTVGSFFPEIFGDGNNLYSTIAGSALLWIIFFMIRSGIQEAVFANLVITLSKVVPIFLFIIIGFFFFNSEIFLKDFWAFDKGSLFGQARNMAIITVWVFLGIEGAGLYTRYARGPKDVSTATFISFFFVLVLLVAVNVISHGIMDQGELENLRNPSTAYVLEKAIGYPGFLLMSIGLLISILGAYLAWNLLAVQIMHVMAMDKTFPKFFAKTTEKNVPINSLFFTIGITQAFIILTYFTGSIYNDVFYQATVVVFIPYLFATIYAVKYAISEKHNTLKIVFYFLAMIYSLWLIYAGGIEYFLFCSVLTAIGIPFYVKASQENNRAPFEGNNKYFLIFLILVLVPYLFFLLKSFF